MGRAASRRCGLGNSVIGHRADGNNGQGTLQEAVEGLLVPHQGGVLHCWRIVKPGYAVSTAQVTQRLVDGDA